MAIIVDLVRVGFQLAHTYKDASEDFVRESGDYAFFEKPLVKKGFLMAGLSYLAMSLYTIGIQIGNMATSNLHQLAALALCSPPILSTVIFAFATAYQGLRLARTVMTSNPYNKATESAQHEEWRKNKRADIASTMLILSVCTAFLAASLIPFPGASNALGLVALGVLVVADVVQAGVKEWNRREKEAALKQPPAQPSSNLRDSFSNTPSDRESLNERFSVSTPQSLSIGSRSSIESSRSLSNSSLFSLESDRSSLDSHHSMGMNMDLKIG